MNKFKLKRKLLPYMTGMGLFVLSSVNVNAAYAEAQANIDWSTFSVSILSGGLTLNYPGVQSDRVESNTDTQGYFSQSANVWSNLSVASTGSYAFSEAYTGNQAINAYSDADGEYGDALAQRTESFEVVSGAGQIEISVDANIDLYVSGTPDEFAYAKTGLQIDINNDINVQSLLSAELDALLTGESSVTRNTTLTLFIDLEAGDWVTYYAYAESSAVAPVPLPASLLLMTSGLLLVSRFRKIKK